VRELSYANKEVVCSLQEGLVPRLLTRRTFLTTSCSFAIAAATNADPSQPWRVGLVTSGKGDRVLGWFREAFKAKGYHEGKDLIVEFREANGHYSLLPNLVAELVALKPDVIIAEATPAIAAAHERHRRFLSSCRHPPILSAPASSKVLLSQVAISRA